MPSDESQMYNVFTRHSEYMYYSKLHISFFSYKPAHLMSEKISQATIIDLGIFLRWTLRADCVSLLNLNQKESQKIYCWAMKCNRNLELIIFTLFKALSFKILSSKFDNCHQINITSSYRFTNHDYVQHCLLCNLPM